MAVGACLVLLLGAIGVIGWLAPRPAVEGGKAKNPNLPPAAAIGADKKNFAGAASKGAAKASPAVALAANAQGPFKGSGLTGSVNLAGVDFSNGPNGEPVTKHKKDHATIEGYTKEAIVAKQEFVPALKSYMPVRRKTTVVINHGLTTRFFAEPEGQKRSEGHYVHGLRHGTHRYYDRKGNVTCERGFDQGKPSGEHKGLRRDGSVEWRITYGQNGPADLGGASCGGFLMQMAFLAGTDEWRTMNLVPGNDKFGYVWMARIRSARNEFTTDTLQSWFGVPAKLPGATASSERWQYRCKDGVVELRVTPLGDRVSVSGPDLYSTTRLPSPAGRMNTRSRCVHMYGQERKGE